MPLTSGLQIPYGIQPTKAVPVDSYSGPYTGSPDTEAGAIAAANAAIDSNVRFKSMEVRLIIGGISYKYWYKNGIADTDLVEFVGSGISVANASDNRVLTSTGSSTGINAESNLTFDGTDLTVTGDINVNGATSADVKTTTATATLFNQPTTLSLGAAATSLTVGGVATAGTTNISNGAISTGIKAINIGTGGTSGSTTNIAIGTSSGGGGTTTINGALSITGNTTIGDSSADTLTINASVLNLGSNLNVGGNTLYVNPTSNYVGINNNSPAYELDVTGKIQTSSDIIVGSNTIKAKVGGAGYIFNDTAASVYIGGTAALNKIGGTNTGDTSFEFGINATASGKTKQVSLGSGGTSGSTTTINIGTANGSSTTQVDGTFKTNGNTTIGDASADSLTINAGTVSLPSGSLNFDSGTLYIDSTNNRVGIVNSSPSTALDVTGNLTTSGDIAVNGGDITTTAATLNIGNTTAAFSANLATGATISGATKTLNLGTGSDVGSTTSVNIGSASGTSTTTVNGALSVTGNTTIGDASADTLTINAGTVSIPNNLNIDSNTLYIDSTNNRVGIGNNAPSTTLHVTGNATVTGNISVTGDTTLGDASGDSITLNASTAAIPNNFNFGSNALYINNANKSIGVGINSVKAKLDVYGDGLFRTTANSTNGVIHPNPLGDGLGAKLDFGTYGTGDGTNYADYGDIGVYGSKFNINSVSRDISFKINAVERMSLSSTSPYSLTLTDGSMLMSSTSARAITHTGASGQNLTISSTNGDVLVEGSTFSGNNITVPGYITFGSSTALRDSGNVTSISLPGSGNVNIAGILRVNGNIIRDSGGVSSITFGGAGSVEIGTDLSVTAGSLISGLSAATAGGNSAANAVAIPYTSNMVAVLQPAASAFYYKLPTAVGNTGRLLTIKNITQNTYSATVYTSVSGQTVDYLGTWNGAASPVSCFILNNTSASGQLNAVTLYSDGSDWFIISSHKNQ